ncbi:DNA translocase FtsK [Lichenihabitans sp. Uapishka_5]|uniref:DNA translocase FtsK n=1 Tax=Lichenihabitans sp. Uapishka_5 TaxID=3037302 RepID=UPI0029E7F5A2|nr:DNA translocase FtsK [Lichenihabitans sp. Uapishka_5]MDX7952470.1 DNA translocase FtsK [Lichenihabitans sp. Uapishka_5]
MSNMEGMVSQVLATHLAQHGAAPVQAVEPAPSVAAVPPVAVAPMPPVAVAPLPAMSAETAAAPQAAAPPPATGNAGLDAMRAQLHESAPGLIQASAVPTPPWLRPFTLPENVRFTRTPDSVMRWERAMPTPDELALKAREAARDAAEEAGRLAGQEIDRMRAEMPDPTPIWRRPFTLPPGVRYTRTPDVRVGKGEAGTSENGGLTPANASTSTSVQESVSTSESPDGAFRAVTFTKTVTTVESVSVSNIEPAGEALMPEAAGAEALSFLAAPQAVAEATAPGEPVAAFHAPVPHTATWVDGLPSWFAVSYPATDLRIAPPALAPIVAEAAPAVVAPVPVEIDDVAPWRSRFLPDMEAVPAVTTPEVVPVGFAVALGAVEPDVGHDPDSDSGAALWRRGFMEDDAVDVAAPAAEIAAVPAVVPQATSTLVVEPARIIAVAPRAFGSHGIPAFESALHVETDPDFYQMPPIDHLAMPRGHDGPGLTREALEQNARLLEGVLEDFGIRGEIIAVRPGPVVTLYELEPAPGVKSSRVVGLADDIARSMSAVSARVAVVQGRNVIGIELPNERRETVFLRELVASEDFEDSNHRLAIALGKTIGGESVIVDLARMPHLLVAGTTGSGKSVAINTMILSLLYRLRPEECRLIMVDPKMLELSIYDGIPHLLTPVVTDSKKAVIALKWAVREMEDRYKKMAKVGVRNIDGFNARIAEAKLKGEVITRTIQQGFDRETGEPMFVTEEMDLAPIPYIVIIVDEMADLMMVAGKEIEGAIQRLAQMARAAGIHLIMATQRPSVDVITGTIKANFPTRISFQVTSKIDSRTILGEQGAEQLLGQGDMLHMAGGGRVVRVHGPFVSDGEVENVVRHLKAQGRPEYLDVVTSDGEPADDGDDDSEAGGGSDAVFDKGSFASAGGDDSADLYDQAVKVVLRDKKCSTSYIQRRLQVGYNKAASLVERMEKEGIVGAANHAGKREILNFSRDYGRTIIMPGEAD